jgi:hypothetical protein
MQYKKYMGVVKGKNGWQKKELCSGDPWNKYVKWKWSTSENCCGWKTTCTCIKVNV